MQKYWKDCLFFENLEYYVLYTSHSKAWQWKLPEQSALAAKPALVKLTAKASLGPWPSQSLNEIVQVLRGQKT